MRILHAQLEYPTGVTVNRAYRTSRTQAFYKDDKVSAWQDRAVKDMRAAGITPGAVPSSEYYWCVILSRLRTTSMDIDGPIKATKDAVKKALDVDDKWNGVIIPSKEFVPHLKDMRFDIWVIVIPLAGSNPRRAKDHFSDLSSRLFHQLFETVQSFLDNEVTHGVQQAPAGKEAQARAARPVRSRGLRDGARARLE
jgi:hypothetical protein